MRHVITGGSGFTGSALTYQLLERSEEVVNFDLIPPADPILASSTRFICGDIRKPHDLAQLKLGRDDVVYHLASRQVADAVPRLGRDAWFSETNVQGTQNVVDAMRVGGAHHRVSQGRVPLSQPKVRKILDTTWDPHRFNVFGNAYCFDFATSSLDRSIYRL